ncbi:MAG: two-component sensor histidine kinase [Alphaproteobacteria bacterium]|nr:two-component sensor histidine kinase [Alphaproteobacteria bacterium]
MSDDSELVLVDALPVPAVVIGANERVRRINNHAQNLIGTDCTGWHYITALRQPGVLDAVEASLRDGGHRNARFLGSDGARDTTWDVTLVGAVLPAGRAVVLTFQDITAVEEAGQMRRDFIANVSHELRTPLTAVLGFIETLRGPARDDAAARDRFLDIMEKEAGRMHRLVEDLLSLSRVEDQERNRPRTSVDLGQVIDGALDPLHPLAAERGMRIAWTAPDARIRVAGDSTQLAQVVTNLVENAVKYGHADSTITVTLTEPAPETSLRQHGVRLSVTDEGEGIPVHHIARLTERFYRVDTHRSREIGGTGLGLAIVKHIVNRHRGRLRVASELRQGSTFTVILPIQELNPAADAD